MSLFIAFFIIQLLKEVSVASFILLKHMVTPKINKLSAHLSP